MDNASFDTATAQKIMAARQVGARAYAESMVEIPSIAALMADRAVEQGNQTYLIYRDGDTRTALTYSQFYQRCNRVAQVMVKKLGLKPGDRIATVAYNHPDTVIVYFAAWLAGLVVVPFNAGDSDERMVFSFTNADVRAVFVMPELLGRIVACMEQFSCVKHVVQINGTKGDVKHLPTLEGKVLNKMLPLDLANQDSEALIVYTSGTTGNPKGVLLQQRNLLADIQEISNWYGFNDSDRAMLILPIHHVNGLVVTLLTPMFAGASTVLNRKFSASKYWQIVEEEGCTYGSVVPTILSFLLEAGEDIHQRELGKYFLICGAGPLTVEVARRFENKFPVPIIHGYGLSETTCYSCYLPFDLTDTERKSWLYDYGYPSIGVALPCNDMDIHDAQGKSVPEGERGEIVIRGQNVMYGYFKRPEANADTFAFNWFRSGDEGFYKTDSKGRKFFFITGRLKELIIRGGVNYSPLEIDEVINKIPGVKAGMAVGFEHHFYGEEIGAFVVTEDGKNMTAEQVLEGCRCLPFAKRPKVVVFGDEFPVTATGKYQRLKLRPLFEQWKETQFREEK